MDGSSSSQNAKRSCISIITVLCSLGNGSGLHLLELNQKLKDGLSPREFTMSLQKEEYKEAVEDYQFV